MVESLLFSVATDEVVKSVSPTKDSVTEPMETDAPTSWEKWEDTSDWDYTDFGGSESIQILCDLLLLH